LRPLRGSHLLFDAWRLPLAQAIAFFHPDDRRPMFAIPWEGSTLVGASDVDHPDDLDREPGIARAELDYILRAARSEFPSLGLGEADVVSTWSGVRPVIASGPNVDPSKEKRDSLILNENGLITVTGGKLTTFRSTAIAALGKAAEAITGLKTADAGSALFAPPAASTLDALREHRGCRLRQRRNDLRRTGDAIPVARNRLEGVVHGDSRVAEVFDLLEHWVRQPVGESVAGKEEHGKTIGMRRSRRRRHIEGAGADRRRRDHDLPTALGFGEANGCERHRLFVLSAPSR